MNTPPNREKNKILRGVTFRSAGLNARRVMIRIKEARVTRVWTRIKGDMPALKRDFPTVPQEAHMRAAAITQRYPFAEFDFMHALIAGRR
jgi:hypothetical protein